MGAIAISRASTQARSARARLLAGRLSLSLQHAADDQKYARSQRKECLNLEHGSTGLLNAQCERPWIMTAGGALEFFVPGGLIALSIYDLLMQ